MSRLVLTLATMGAVLGLLGPTPAVTAQDRIPGGGVAQASGAGPVRAWYGQPTTRYGHGILGDAIEGGSLVAVDDAGRRHELVLPARYVFEDITPRLVDLDGDGRNEIVTIRTDTSAGAAVAVYGIVGGEIVERAATAPIGLPRRWLSIAGIADFHGAGRPQIAIVKTPHIGGVLEVLALQGNRLARLYPAQSGYSSHFIGSTNVSLAGVGDVDGEGRPDLALPDQSRRRLIVLSFGAGIETLSRTDLPARVNRPIRVEGGGRVAVPLENGQTMTVRVP